MKNLTIIRSILHESEKPGKGAGAAIDDAHGATVYLEDMDIHQYPTQGNARVIFIGDGDPKRCFGTDGVRGKWTVKRLKVYDRETRNENDRVVFITSGCPDLKRTWWNDKGGNEYLTPGPDGEWVSEPFFKDIPALEGEPVEPGKTTVKWPARTK